MFCNKGTDGCKQRWAENLICLHVWQVLGPEQDVVLNYGIWTAAVLRAVMAYAGVELVDQFEPVLLVFAGILLYSSYQLLFASNDEKDEDDLQDNSIVNVGYTVISI